MDSKIKIFQNWNKKEKRLESKPTEYDLYNLRNIILRYVLIVSHSRSTTFNSFSNEGQKIFLVTILHSSTAQAVLFCYPKRLTLSCKVGGKA